MTIELPTVLAAPVNGVNGALGELALIYELAIYVLCVR